MPKLKIKTVKKMLCELIRDAHKASQKYEDEEDLRDPKTYHGFEASAFQVGYLEQGIRSIIDFINMVESDGSETVEG